MKMGCWEGALAARSELEGLLEGLLEGGSWAPVAG